MVLLCHPATLQIQSRAHCSLTTVIPVIAFGLYDNPEMHKVTGVKDFYRGSPAMCTM